jgi:hypothetical protein
MTAILLANQTSRPEIVYPSSDGEPLAESYDHFDPRGEWIPEKLRGYRLQGDLDPVYVPITNNQSTPLQLQLMVENKIIAFYRLDNGERLLPLAELNIALEEQSIALEEQSAALEEQSAALDRQKELTVQADQRAELAAEKAREEAVRADREAQRVKELELQVALYQQRLGELPTD